MMGLDTSLVRLFSVKGRCIHPHFSKSGRNGKSMNTCSKCFLFPGNAHDLCFSPILRDIV